MGDRSARDRRTIGAGDLAARDPDRCGTACRSGWIGDALYVFTADERPFAVRIDWVSATEANEFIEIAGTALQRDRDQHRLNCRACGLEVWSGPTGVITIRPDGESSTLLLVTPSTNHAAQLIEAVR